MKLRLWPLWLITPVSLFAQTTPTVTAPPTPTTITVDATHVVQTLDPRFYGINLVIWDDLMTKAPTPTLVDALHQNIFRYPGGSLSDEYNWATHAQITDKSTYAGWPNSVPDFAKFIEQRGAQGIVTVNYGTGTPQMAEALVAYLNGTTSAASTIGIDARGTDWKTAAFWANLRGVTPLAIDDGYNFLRIGHVAPFNVKYWEIGNEIYGSAWETDYHGKAGSGLTGTANDPYTYAQAFATFQTAMHAADPTIQIGAVSTEFENDYGIGTHAVTNPVTSKSYTGWTPVMLATMKAAGIAPDFLIYHYYPQNAKQENDNVLLQAGPVLKTVATDIRQRLNDYLGVARANKVELMVTEINSVSANPGKQASNLVNGLFYADAFGSIAQTEFKTAIWWDLHNGVNNDPANDNESASLYGWRLFGCYDIITGTNFSPSVANNEPLPVYYGMKLLSHWAQAGDRIVATQSNYNWLSAYSAKLVDGTLAILVVNKNPATDVSAQISLTGYSAPLSTATIYSYGKTNDAQYSANPDLSATTITSASTNFNYTFPSYSMTVIRLSQPPTAPSITTQPANAAVPLGNTTRFSVVADGTGPFTYQWFKDNVAISGATSASLSIANVQPSDFGSYAVTVTNGLGSLESQPAMLGQSTAHLSNVSMRVQAAGGFNTPIVGVILSGSGTAPLLIRALGPALIKQGLTSSQTLADPTFGFYSGQTQLVQNDNWDPSAATEMAAFPALALDANSLDAAVVQQVGPGGYTALLQTKNNAQGIALLEMYSLEGQTAQLRNISGRALVGTGANVLIAGFIISGNGSVNVLVRGLGPSLIQQGVSSASALANPNIDVYAGSTWIGGNDDWAFDPNAAETTAAMVKTGALPMTDKESALTLTLTAGVPYTVIVSGVGGTTGVGLAEVFQVP